MLNENAAAILKESKKRGWVLEPEAKRLFAEAGFDVPRFEWVRTEEEAIAAGERIGWQQSRPFYQLNTSGQYMVCIAEKTQHDSENDQACT